MRILLDECCDGSFARLLRARGHDVIAVIDASPGASDEAVLDLASREACLLITSDKDYSDLVFRMRREVPGFVLLRMNPGEGIGARLATVLEQLGDRLIGHHATVTMRHVRLRPLPAQGS